MTRPVILLTRPEPSSRRMAAILTARFGDRVDLCLSPLMNIVLDARLPDLDGIRTLIFTSANGVAAYLAAQGPKTLPCYTVGDATAHAAILGVALYYAITILYFSLVGRKRLVLSPEEEFAMSRGHAEDRGD